VGFVYLAALEITKRPLLSLLAPASFAVSPLFWLWSTVAGVRSAAALTVAVVVYLAFRWERETKSGARSAATKSFTYLALAYGMALAHHRSAILLALPLGCFIIVVDRQVLLSFRRVAISALLFVLPLLTYLYLPVRSIMGAPFDQFHPDTFPRFLDLVLATRLSQSFLSVPLEQMPARCGMLGANIVEQFGVVGLGMGVLGGATLAWRRFPVFLLTALFALSLALQTLDWNVGEDHLNTVYLIPAYVVIVLWIANGALFAGDLISNLRYWHRPALAYAGITGLLLLLEVPMGLRGWEAMAGRAGRPLDNFRQSLDGGFLARRLVMASLPHIEDNAVVFADWEQATPLWYAQQIEGIKPNVEIVYGLSSIADAERRAAGRPAYLARALPGGDGLRFTCVGPLVRIGRSPSKVVPVVHPLNLTFDSQISLLGFVLYDERGVVIESIDSKAQVLPVELYWQALTRPTGDYSVSVRLVDHSGKLLRQSDNQHPVLSMYPTNRWEAGEVVGDYYELSMAGLDPGTYRLEALLYSSSPSGWRNLDVSDASGWPIGDRATITQVIVR
jgi:hypothetical protein